MRIKVSIIATVVAMVCLANTHTSPGEDNNNQSVKLGPYAENPCQECEIYDGKNCIPDPDKQLPPNTQSTGKECCGETHVPAGLMSCEGHIYDPRMKNCCPGNEKSYGPPDCCDPCKEAEELGLFKPDSDDLIPVGMIICCHGKKYICLMPKNAPENLNPRAKEDYMDCILKHEEENFYDPEIICPGAVNYNKITSTLAPHGHKNKAEWQAYSNTIDCLQSKINNIQKELDQQFNLSKYRSQKQLEDAKIDIEKVRNKYYANTK